MLNIGDIAQTVQHNCHISDARFAGHYSMCIFLLKMREYYRWEHDIPLSHTLEKSKVGDWLIEREQSWEEYEEQNYQPLTLPGGAFDPFDAEAINRRLIPHGYIYSSGYGIYQKPHFFLGQLDKQQHSDQLKIFISSCEYARDLSAPPAMSLNDNIFIRRESLRRMIWEKIEEWQWKRDPNTAMARVLDQFPTLQDHPETLLDNICDNEVGNMILHEIGETQAGIILGDAWKTMLSQIPRSQTELYLRAVRDHLADCLSTLPALLDQEQENHTSVHFYFANFNGLRKKLFPSLFHAYEQWCDTSQKEYVIQAIESGRLHWQSTAQDLLNQFQQLEAEQYTSLHNTIQPY